MREDEKKLLIRSTNLLSICALASIYSIISSDPDTCGCFDATRVYSLAQVTYVVLESQYQSSLTKACQRINESRDDVCVECVGYLLEELRDPKNVAAFKKDVESSNIFIGSLIFVQVRIYVPLDDMGLS